jgi:uncharacterized protein with HEPN domain
MSRDLVTLADVYIALTRIREFIADMTRDDFVDDEKTHSAVLLKLMIIGEAIKRLSSEFREAHSEVNWKEYAGFRDVLIHQYDDVNLETVWDIVTNELPVMFERVARILPQPPIES